jgi:hypothetical protein
LGVANRRIPEPVIGPRSVLALGILLVVSLAAAKESLGLRGALAPDDATTPPVAVTPAPPPAIDTAITGAVIPKPSANPVAAKVTQAAVRATPAAPVDTSDAAKGIITGVDLRRTVAEDPYAPLGIRIGEFTYYPAVTVSGGYTTNATAAAGGSGAPLVAVAPEAVLKSNWARHEMTLTMRGSYETFPGSSAPVQPTAEILATGRLDLADRWTANLEGGYDFSRQSVSDPNFPAGAITPPAVHDGHAAIALNGGAGPSVFTLAGRAERTVYENAVTPTKIIDQSARNNDLFSGRLRLGYEVTPTFTPFVEGELAERLYDRHLDDNGIARSSHDTALRAGFAFNDAPVLSGEIAVGGRSETFDDKALATLHALTVDGSLVWSPTALVSVTTKLATSFNPGTDPASSGSVVYDGTVDLAYAYRRNLTIDWTAGVRNEHFQGTRENDWTYNLGLGTVWKLNRNLQLTSGYVHEWLGSNVAGRKFTADTLRVDLRVQE